MELVIGIQHRTPDMVVHGSGESGGHCHWSFLMNSGSFDLKPFLCAAYLSLTTVVERDANKVLMSFL